MLVAAVVRLPLDVQDDPARLRVAVSRALTLDRLRVGLEQARRRRVRGGPHGTVIGTYMHGPLLPKNAWFADWLTQMALGRQVVELAPLDDALEDAAHAAARRAAGM